AEGGIRGPLVTGVQTCALPIFAAVFFLRRVWSGAASSAVEVSAALVSSVLFIVGYPFCGRSALTIHHSSRSGKRVQDPENVQAEIGRASCRERVWRNVGGEREV